MVYMVDDEAHGGGVAQDHAGVPQRRQGVRACAAAAPGRAHALRVKRAALPRALLGRGQPHLDCIGKAARSGLQTAASRKCCRQCAAALWLHLKPTLSSAPRLPHEVPLGYETATSLGRIPSLAGLDICLDSGAGRQQHTGTVRRSSLWPEPMVGRLRGPKNWCSSRMRFSSSTRSFRQASSDHASRCTGSCRQVALSATRSHLCETTSALGMQSPSPSPSFWQVSSKHAC